MRSSAVVLAWKTRCVYREGRQSGFPSDLLCGGTMLRLGLWMFTTYAIWKDGMGLRYTLDCAICKQRTWVLIYPRLWCSWAIRGRQCMSSQGPYTCHMPTLVSLHYNRWSFVWGAMRRVTRCKDANVLVHL